MMERDKQTQMHTEVCPAGLECNLKATSMHAVALGQLKLSLTNIASSDRGGACGEARRLEAMNETLAMFT